MITTKHQIHYCFTSGVLEKKCTNVIQPCKVLCQHHFRAVLEVPWYNRICTGNLSSACHFCVWVCTPNMETLCFSTDDVLSPQLVTQRLHRPFLMPLCLFTPLFSRNRHWIKAKYSGEFAQHLKAHQLMTPEIASTEHFSLVKNLQARMGKTQMFFSEASYLLKRHGLFWQVKQVWANMQHWSNQQERDHFHWCCLLLASLKAPITLLLEIPSLPYQITEWT